MPLCDCTLDHLAVALESPKQLRLFWQELTDGGAETIEPVIFPPYARQITLLRRMFHFSHLCHQFHRCVTWKITQGFG